MYIRIWCGIDRLSRVVDVDWPSPVEDLEAEQYGWQWPLFYTYWAAHIIDSIVVVVVVALIPLLNQYAHTAIVRMHFTIDVRLRGVFFNIYAHCAHLRSPHNNRQIANPHQDIRNPINGARRVYQINGCGLLLRCICRNNRQRTSQTNCHLNAVASAPKLNSQSAPIFHCLDRERHTHTNLCWQIVF